MNELKFRLLIIFSAAWRRRYAIVIPILLMPIIAFAISGVAPLKYKAHTSMLIQETAKMNPFLEDLAVSTMLKDRITALKTLLNSRHVLRSVAFDLGLINDNMRPDDIERIISKIAVSLKVTQLSKDFIKIEHTADRPDGMKALLESVSIHFIEELLAPERSSIRDSSEFLAIHIDKRKKELNEAELALADYYNRFSSSTPEMQNENLSRLASLRQTLAEKEAELSGVEKSLGTLDQQLSKTNPIVGRIEEQIIETRSALTLLKAKYTSNHSAVQAKNRELQRLEQERTLLLNSEQSSLDSEQLWGIASASSGNDRTNLQPLLITQLHSLQLVRGKYESLKQETASLTTMIDDLTSTSQTYGSNAKQLLELTRDVGLKRQLYDELVQRYEMAQLTGSLSVFEQNKRVKIIDRPFTPSVPTNLPTFFFILAGIIGGIALGIGTAILLELFDTTIRTKQQLKQVSGLPIVTAIPKCN
ncbi:chain-length determining protein [Vibrio sp. 10N.286.49.C2]|uniref:GumC family protein n=1 Tax=unclassified Vibrio TaxID=2614977 RepID=UPI000C83CF29|nr:MULTISPECIES: GNVR domain-containing protein [unclassified Vibrio]PMH31417.1 chain-length determining protein [Vibrio sp. 10N.286.49.C2]PMH50438.1 chain-length determining protein [Vibrio sp. 10N.286.49.B1]PMH78079.1 chain-length determining protein [Vibrio sp. 10N.286.48.B7]